MSLWPVSFWPLSLWIIISLVIAIPTGIGFLIMAWPDIRSAHYKHHQYLWILGSAIPLCVAFACFLQLEAPTPFLMWLLLPFKILIAPAFCMFCWLIEILGITWLARSVLGTRPAT